MSKIKREFSLVGQDIVSLGETKNSSDPHTNRPLLRLRRKKKIGYHSVWSTAKDAGSFHAWSSKKCLEKEVDPRLSWLVPLPSPFFFPAAIPTIFTSPFQGRLANKKLFSKAKLLISRRRYIFPIKLSPITTLADQTRWSVQAPTKKNSQS